MPNSHRSVQFSIVKFILSRKEEGLNSVGIGQDRMLRRPSLHSVSSTVLGRSCELLVQFVDYKLYHRPISRVGVVGEDGERYNNNESRSGCEFQLYKSKGQHLLTSTRVLDAIVQESNIKATDTVLEIGPGTGNLTLRLLESAQRVVAVELDSRMADALVKRVADSELEHRLTLIREDALKTVFPKFDLVVANIPYNISSPLIAKLLYGTQSFRSATLLLQKEFARRLVAKPGDLEFNRLAVNVELVADVEHIMDVSKRDFFPVPKVDSSVVIIRPKVDKPNVDLSEWCAFTRTCFCKKNKTLGATFKQKKKLMELMRISEIMGSKDKTSTVQDDSALGTTLFKEKVVGILKSSGFEDKRPSKLSVESLLHLLSLFNRNEIYFHDKGGKASNAELAASFEL